MEPDETPSLGTALCAGTAAAVAAVTPLALWGGASAMSVAVLLGVYLFGIPIALAHALVLGLPAYFVLRERWALNWGRAALGGFVVGGLPAALLSLALDADLGALVVFGILGTLGACGGLGFRAYLALLE